MHMKMHIHIHTAANQSNSLQTHPSVAKGTDNRKKQELWQHSAYSAAVLDFKAQQEYDLNTLLNCSGFVYKKKRPWLYGCLLAQYSIEVTFLATARNQIQEGNVITHLELDFVFCLLANA